MLILSVGLVKSGSAWFFGLTNDLLKAAGHPGTQSIKDSNELDFIKWSTFNIQKLDIQKLDILTSLPVSKFTYAVKTHSPPIPEVENLLNNRQLFVSYIYRDPRDIVLAGLDAGKELRSRGVYDRFGSIYTFNDALHWCHNHLKSSWDSWSKLDKINFFKYEELNNDTGKQLQRLSNLLDLGVSKNEITKIVNRHSAQELINNKSKKYHFNKGISFRFMTEMTSEQLDKCNTVFRRYILEMGYEF